MHSTLEKMRKCEKSRDLQIIFLRNVEIKKNEIIVFQSDPRSLGLKKLYEKALVGIGDVEAVRKSWCGLTIMVRQNFLDTGRCRLTVEILLKLKQIP